MKKLTNAHVMLLVTTLIGIMLFIWPMITGGQPLAAAAISFGLGTAAILVAMEVVAGHLDTRKLALLAALAAIDAAARAVLVTGIGGFSPIFLMILCGGYIFGAEYGFLLGSITILVSAFVTGGLGPWLPYQMFAAGWVGMIAGMAGIGCKGRPSKRDVIILAAVGLVLGYGYGAVMDIWDWTFYQSSPGLGFSPGMSFLTVVNHFAKFYAATSFVYDSFRAVGNVIMISVLGAPILLALGRLRARLNTDIDESVMLITTDVNAV